MRPRVAWALLVALGAGCASPSHPAVSHGATPGATTAPPRGALDAAGATWVFSAAAGVARWGKVAEVSPDGTRRMFYGAGRYEARGDVVEAAADMTADGIHTAVNLGGTWRFFSQHGVWESQGFLGPLRRVAWFPAGWVGVGGGLAGAVDDGRVVGAEAPPEHVFIDAAFANEQQGVAVVEPGEVLATEDGGAHWRRVATGDELPAHVDAVHARRWISASGTVHRVDGARRNPRGERFHEPAQPVSAEDIERIEEHPSGAPHGVEALALVGRGRRRAVVSGGQSGLLDLDLDTGELAEMESAPCAPQDWIPSEEALIVCRTDYGAVVHARGERGWEERLRVHACGPLRCAATEDGSVVGCTGRCDEDAPCPAATVLCERHGAGPARETAVGDASERWSFLGYDGYERVLVEARDDLWRARVRRGEAAPVPVATSLPVPHPQVMSSWPRLGRDGMWRVEARSDVNAPSVVLEGVPGGAWRMREGPPWRAGAGDDEATSRVCSEDGVWVALAPDGTPWVSARGDAPWRALDVEGGRPELARWLRSLPRDARTLACNAAGWKVGDAAVWAAGWGPALRMSETWVTPPIERADFPPWTCARGDVVHDLRVDRQTMAHEAEVFVTNGAAFEHPPRMEFSSWEWSTPEQPDARVGDYDVRMPPALVASMGGASRAELQWGILELGPARALVHVWDPAPDQNRPSALLELSASAPPRAVHRYRARGPGADAWNLVARDGDTLAMLSVGTGESPEGVPDGYSVATLLQRVNGRYATRGVLVPAPGVALRGAYAIGAEAGLLRVLDDGTLVAQPFIGNPRVLGRGLRVGACGASARGDVAFDARVDVDEMPDPVDFTATVHASLDGAALCVRSMTAIRFVLAPSRESGASLSGYMGEDGVWYAMRCGWSEAWAWALAR